MVVLMQLVRNLAPIPTVKMVRLDMADHILNAEYFITEVPNKQEVDNYKFQGGCGKILI